MPVRRPIIERLHQKLKFVSRDVKLVIFILAVDPWRKPLWLWEHSDRVWGRGNMGITEKLQVSRVPLIQLESKGMRGVGPGNGAARDEGVQ